MREADVDEARGRRVPGFEAVVVPQKQGEGAGVVGVHVGYDARAGGGIGAG